METESFFMWNSHKLPHPNLQPDLKKEKKIAMTSFWQFYFPVELKWVGRFHDHGTQATLVEPTEMSASHKVQPHARPTQYIRILNFLQPSYPHAVLAETN